MRKRSWQAVAFLLSCAAFSTAGWRLAFSAHPAVAGKSVRGRSVHDRRGKVEGGDVSAAPAPLTRMEVGKKLLARAKTEDLWTWVTQPEMLDLMEPAPADAMLEELIRRLGWGAWDRALALEEPEARREISGRVLDMLAERDPWKAYELWKAHREEFPAYWGEGVLPEARNAAAGVSAQALIEVLDEEERFPQRTISVFDPRFAPGFDFPVVLEYLRGKDAKWLTEGQLLEGWAQGSPVAASQWLVEHSDQAGDVRLLRQIAAMKADTPGRAEALDILGRMPVEDRGSAWWEDRTFRGGTLSPEMLAATTQLQQREEYLGDLMERTLYDDELDPSWQQIPAQEREEVAVKVESTMRPVEKLSPLERRQRERWRRIVSAGPK